MKCQNKFEQLKEHKRKCARKIGTILSNISDSAFSIMHEIYYEERMYLQYSFYLFVKHFDISDYCKTWFTKLLLSFEVIFCGIFFIIDAKILMIWIRRVLQEDTDLLGILNSLGKRLEYVYTKVFVVCLICL